MEDELNSVAIGHCAEDGGAYASESEGKAEEEAGHRADFAGMLSRLSDLDRIKRSSYRTQVPLHRQVLAGSAVSGNGGSVGAHQGFHSEAPGRDIRRWSKMIRGDTDKIPPVRTRPLKAVEF